MSWLAAHFDLADPGWWAFITAAAAILAVNCAWLATRAAEAARGRTVARVIKSPPVQAAAWLIASLYLLLPPFDAWRYGAISPYLLGIAELDWVESLRAGGPFVALALGLVVFGWLVYRRALPPDGPASPGMPRALCALRAAIDAGLTQWRLAFCRAALIAWLMAPSSFAATFLPGLRAQPFYWGSWLGLGLALIEAGLNPFFRDALWRPSAEARRQDRPEALLRSLGLAIATTGLFVLTRNFWLCLVCQVVADTVIVGWLPLRRSAAQALS